MACQMIDFKLKSNKTPKLNYSNETTTVQLLMLLLNYCRFLFNYSTTLRRGGEGCTRPMGHVCRDLFRFGGYFCCVYFLVSFCSTDNHICLKHDSKHDSKFHTKPDHKPISREFLETLFLNDHTSFWLHSEVSTCSEGHQKHCKNKALYNKINTDIVFAKRT